MSRDDLIAWHERTFTSGNACVSICGEVAFDQIAAQFIDLPARGSDAALLSTDLPLPDPVAPRLFLLDLPGAEQSTIMGAIAFPWLDPGDIGAAALVNATLGGSFDSRLNMNLREDKRWAYGAGSGVTHRRGPGAVTVSAAVQLDRTGAAMIKMTREVRELGSVLNKVAVRVSG